MKKHFYGVIWVILVTLVFTAKAGAQSPEITLQISLDQPQYVVGETIIVNSTLENNSQKSKTLLEPRVAASVVTFTLETLVEGKWSNNLKNRRGFMWSPNQIEVPALGNVSNSFEFMRALGRGELQPGKYKLQGVYHFVPYGSDNYETDVLLSNEVEFSINPLLAEHKMQIEELNPCLENSETLDECFESFLARTPKSIYRVELLDWLHSNAVQKNDLRKQVQLKRRLRNERISNERKEFIVLEEANDLIKLGDYQQAEDLIKNARLLHAQDIKKKIEETKKLNRDKQP